MLMSMPTSTCRAKSDSMQYIIRLLRLAKKMENGEGGGDQWRKEMGKRGDGGGGMRRRG